MPAFCVCHIDKEIVYYSDLGKIMIIGDLNARTGQKLDYLEGDDCRYIPVDDDYTVDSDTGSVLNRRQSQDNVVSQYGNSLLDMCI